MSTAQYQNSGDLAYEIDHHGTMYTIWRDDFGYIVKRNDQQISWQISLDLAVRYALEHCGQRPYKPEYNCL